MLLSLAVALACAASSHSASTSSASGRDIIDTGYAKYQGNRSFVNTVAYLGIPYAEPPVGEGRWRAPLPLNTTRVSVESEGKVIDATEYPEFCIQGALGPTDRGGAGSEDCLKVNIYAPFGAKEGSNLPVLVYIHGGGYTFGNPANWPFDHWIHQSPNVVVVSVYYRLASFGFLAHPSFTAFDPSSNSSSSSDSLGDLNTGFLDQVQALKWVQSHIASFGGDPTKVTINGESAGGGSVEMHLVAKNTGSLFTGAIAQSVDRAPMAEPAQLEPLFNFFADLAGCGGQSSVEDTMACLRAAPVDALAPAQDTAARNFTGSYKTFLPVLDGTVFTSTPTQLILNGDFTKVPLIVGATSNETVTGGTNFTTALQATFPELTEADLEGLEKAYPLEDFDDEAQRFRDATGENVLRCAREILGGAFASATGQSWTYRYNQANPTNTTSPTVNHAAENWMMFLGTNTGSNGSTTFSTFTPVETAFAEELIAYWLSFVRAEDPNTHKLARSPTWESYVGKERIVLQQDPGNSTTKSGSFVEEEPEKEEARCDFVGSLAGHEQN